MSLFDLTGKTAVVTGSSRGIGRAIALRLAEHGARVVVSSRKQAACEAVRDEIVAANGEAIVKACNVAHKDQLEALVDAAYGQWGRLDVLVCNAAVNPYFGPAAGIADDTYDYIMNCNVRSNFWLCNMVAPRMAKEGGGAIVIVSSIAGFQGNDKLGVYALSKAADMQLVRNVAVEWGPQGVRANCIAPGLVRTDFARAIWEDPAAHKMATRMAPLRRIGEPDEIAGAAVFLAAPASGFMTGQTMLIDGGRLIAGRAAAMD